MEAVTLHYSKNLVQSAVRSYWFRVVGWRFLVAIGVLAVALGYFIYQGELSWVVGVLATVLMTGLLMIVALYVVHYRGTLQRFRALKTPEARFDPDDEVFRISSDAGTAEMRWNVLRELWRFPDYWLVFFSRCQFVTLPTADLTPEVQSFIIAKVESNGGKID